MKYRIELVPMSDAAHPDYRVKRLLKIALRLLRLRCTHCSLVETD